MLVRSTRAVSVDGDSFLYPAPPPKKYNAWGEGDETVLIRTQRKMLFRASNDSQRERLVPGSCPLQVLHPQPEKESWTRNSCNCA